MLQKLEDFHRLFYDSIHKIPKRERYVLGIKIDNLIVEMLVSLYDRENTKDPQEKLVILKEFDRKLFMLKYFFRLLYSRKSISERKYLLFESKLIEIGKILGGLIRKNAPQKEA